MKNITELSEQEILSLTEDQIELMIKLKMAEEGVKFLSMPTIPNYFEIQKPDKTVFYCNLFGDSITFENANELEDMISLIKASNSIKKLDYGIGDVKYQAAKLYNYGEWDTITSKQAYSFEVFQQVKELLSENAKLKKAYDEEKKAYDAYVSDSKWIKEEIWNAFYEVQNKYDNLNSLCRRFKNDYLPLSENNIEIAMKFMNKAYDLTEDQKELILSNYNS